ncbi:MAG: chromosome segregation protein SMC [Betaproteobacteria bacterium]
MRLTHIKLAGFKSFVDPTHIPVPGKLVGVVGPNGCGKSNVIDAVRWVLGETSAKQLRGDNMQDVIFAGTTDRKPVSRASVELVFDNSLGRLTGPWSEYAEISVKRILEREGASSYYINNQHVRRRDVADIFLGTGLGGRGYAIIEQGMISRIIEAKPEDMRAFLEEAAGVSKYRERRRETELRLQDTRENLSRVEDIRGELDKQLRHLENQAKKAEKFNELQAELKHTQEKVWVFKKRDADNLRESVKVDLEAAKNEIEKQVAKLRATELDIEKIKEERNVAIEVVNEAQGGVYEANSEVAKLEQAIEYHRENRRRTQTQLQQIKKERERLKESLYLLEKDVWGARADKLDADSANKDALNALDVHRGQLPEVETAFNELRATSAQKEQELSQAKRQVEVTASSKTHINDSLAQLESRKSKLIAEKDALISPDSASLIAMRQSLDVLDSELVQDNQSLLDAEQELERQEEHRGSLAAKLDQFRIEYARVEAKSRALEELQDRASDSEKLDSWLERIGVSGEKQLWQAIRVEDGWGDAVEAILGDWLVSVGLDNMNLVLKPDEPLPTKASFRKRTFPEREDNISPAASDLAPLISVISVEDESVRHFLENALGNVFLSTSEALTIEHSSLIKPGMRIVNRKGDVLSFEGLVLFAPDDKHGMLARQQELERLHKEALSLDQDIEQISTKIASNHTLISQLRENLVASRKHVSSKKEKLHEERVNYLRLNDLNERTAERLASIDEELAEIGVFEKHEKNKSETVEAELQEASVGLQKLDSDNAAHSKLLQQKEAELLSLRDRVASLALAHQEKAFHAKSIGTKIEELTKELSGVYRNFVRLDSDSENLNNELSTNEEAEQVKSLETALTKKAAAEDVLRKQRDALAATDQKLSGAENVRSAANSELQPIKDRESDLRLKEQEYRIAADNIEQLLRESEANVEEILRELDDLFDVDVASESVGRLTKSIQSLGAVNMAALEELSGASERKNYLDSQAEDLIEAVATLESAIKQMDKETRERLQETFDKVNVKFSEMFPALFGGGEAKLELTGEEILDAGINVIARPPGKRNSSIQLLSGGEKALTALSLVFALFQLNPAPFCLLDEVDAPLDDNNTTRYCELVKKMSTATQFLFITHNKITMELAEQLVGVTMQEKGVSRVVAVDIDEAVRLKELAA